MKKRRLSWPTYLAILVGVAAAVDLAFGILGFGRMGLIWILGFVVLCIVVDFLRGETPSKRQREEGR